MNRLAQIPMRVELVLPRAGGWARFWAGAGEWLRLHRRWVLGLQWVVVLFYAGLVSLPAFLPAPPLDAHIYDNLTLLAQFLFWGIWWPFVILTTLFAGRLWCGLFCPEGALTEQVSRIGLNRRVPRWLRWAGWPFVAFIMTTVYGQLVSVYEYPQPALLILGGSTVAAIAVGLVFGREKRVWCRYLCPVTGVFALLGRFAPLAMQVDPRRWAAHAPNLRYNCAPLVDVRHMASAGPCHLCGQCSGFREAVWLAPRVPGAEIVAAAPREVGKWEVRLLLFGILGVAIGAFTWSASPWFVMAKQAVAEWLVEHERFALLESDIPWWLLTHWPAQNDVFTWLDGLMILGYIGATALLLGGWLTLALRIAAAFLAGDARAHARGLALCLVPLGGVGLFLGLSALTVGQLKPEGVGFEWLPAARAALLAGGTLISAALAAAWLRRQGRAVPSASHLLAAWGMFVAGMGPVAGAWVLLFFVW